MGLSGSVEKGQSKTMHGEQTIVAVLHRAGPFPEAPLAVGAVIVV